MDDTRKHICNLFYFKGKSKETERQPKDKYGGQACKNNDMLN